MIAENRLIQRVAIVAYLFLSACPPPGNTMDSGVTLPAPTVTSMSPTSGPASGGTDITVNGSNFVDGATVTIGGVAATSVIVQNKLKLTAKTGPSTASARVELKVTNPDGQSATLSSAYQYNQTSVAIAEAVLLNAATDEQVTSATSATVQISGTVQVPQVTVGAGPGAGIRAQVGFGSTLSTPIADGDFAWTDATYTGDSDGATAGDKARDTYGAGVVISTPTAGPATFFLAIRFSVDDGASWKIADRDGVANGTDAAQIAKVTLKKAGVDWCKLGGEIVEAPQAISQRAGTTGPIIYGQVYQANVTNMTGAGAGIHGQLGFGMAGTNPSTWTWADATFNHDTGSGANDEYQLALPIPAVGNYVFAFRFSTNNTDWSYCDADGLANGFTEAQAGTLAVTPVSIRCNLQFPTTLDAREGRPAGLVYGRVFMSGITDATGPSTGLTGELGIGPTGSTAADAGWTWSAATYNVKAPLGGEEYQSQLVGPAPGVANFAYRFKYLSSPWTYCDLDGSDNGYQSAQAGVVTTRAFAIDECILDAANSTQSLPPGVSSLAFTGRVKIPTLTEASGQGAGVTAEIGYGAVGSAPSTWTTWNAATYASDSTDFDVYSATLNTSATGSYDVAYRFKLGNGAYAYCDKDGFANGFQSAQAGRFVVSSFSIQSCRLMSVSAFSIASGDPVTAVVRVASTGVTNLAGPSAQIAAQFGVGTAGVNASASNEWGWQTGVYMNEVADAGADEYALTFRPAYSGSRSVSARVSLSQGPWVYCDLNGSDVNGYEVAQQYDVAVGTQSVIPFCNTQFPSTVSKGSLPDGGSDVYGQVYLPNVTPSATAGIQAQFGFGPKVEDPGLAWTWSSAPFSSTVANNNEYLAKFSPAATGLSYAFRYTLDGGVFCYGDLDGSQNGFSGETTGGGANLGLVTP